MPRYLSLFKYSAEGNKGFLKEKAAGREAAEMPNAAAGAAFVAMVSSTGAFAEFRSIELLSASEIDNALAKSMTYRPPGG